MIDLCKVCLKTVKRFNMVILCDHCDHWIHIQCNNLDTFDSEMLKNSVDLWFCIFCTSNILPFWNRHKKAKETINAPTNLFTITNFFN